MTIAQNWFWKFLEDKLQRENPFNDEGSLIF